MNIFVLDLDPKKCAEYHANKHVVKMITEHNQIFGSIAYLARDIKKKKEITDDFTQKHFQNFPRKKNGEIHPYGIGYINHPCTKWAAESNKNYDWLVKMNLELCKVYSKRYHNRIHKGEAITKWYDKNRPKLPNIEMTPFALAMPDDVKNSDPVIAYRNYYKKYKKDIVVWPENEIPGWFK